eukprot:m.7899 g.7899  ORF g.7899 m.7899 type:complete len:430 (+) comp3797_c3_seq1:165-1454(+)
MTVDYNISLFLTILLPMALCINAQVEDYQYMNLYEVTNAVGRGAVCNDGSPAKFYYRNCTANGDRQHGDPTNYCLKGGNQGVQSIQWFIYLDNGDGAWCHDFESCQSRQNKYRTSTNLPKKIFPSGLLSIYPEANPNFYKQHTVVIPSCSGDLFVGDGKVVNQTSGETTFGGRRIVKTVLEDLMTNTYDNVPRPLSSADQVIISGGAGAVFLSEEIEAYIKQYVPNITIYTICDNCVIPNIKPYKQNSCSSSDTQCPPTQSLKLASSPSSWNLDETRRPSWCNPVTAPNVWECLLADNLVLSLPQKNTLFLLAPLLSTGALDMNGASVKDEAYALNYAETMKNISNSVGYSFSSGCVEQNVNQTSLISQKYVYFAKLNCTQEGVPNPFQFEPIQALAQYLLTEKQFLNASTLRCVGSTSLEACSTPHLF